MPIGIELSSAACRIVELRRGLVWRRAPGETRVAAFRSWSLGSRAPFGAAGPQSMLEPFRGRQASVVVWGVPTDHHVLTVASGTYDRMRIEARARARDAGLAVDGVLSDIAPATSRVDGMGRRDVVLASAPGAQIAAALAPLRTAGITVRAVLTPAAALQSLARLRAATARLAHANAGLEAWVALEETTACIALVHGGALVAARDLPWGFLDEMSDFRRARERYDVAVRLGDELGEYLASCKFDGALSQVFICGAMPELRSMTVHLMELVDVEVEPLDSLFGIDERHVPEPSDEFHDAAAGLRLAWAAAANPHPALDLFRARRRHATKTNLSRAAVFAGAAAGLSLGWSIDRVWPAPAVAPHPPFARGESATSATRTVAPAPSREMERSTVAEAAPARPALLPARTLVAPSGRLIATVVPPPLPLPQTAANEPEAATPIAPASRRPWESVPPLAQMRLVPVSTRATLPPAARERAARLEGPHAVEAPAAKPPAVSAPREQATTPVAAAARGPAAEAALPFDASLETILFGRDRSLAIVNGRIVAIGDEVRGARIVGITPAAVLLRDAQGRLRRLSLGAR